MSQKDLHLRELIDADALRVELTSFTQNDGNDGSSTKVRAKVLTRLKEISTAGRHRCEELLIEDGNGTRCAWRISHLQDELIRVIHDFAVTHVYRSNNASLAEKMSVCAVGGYGRGTLAPGSDIDLLFVLDYKQTAWGEQVVEYILYMLWDMGFKVGHATRNIEECIRLSNEDMTIRTSILEMRYIWGDKSLAKTLAERFQSEIVANTAQEFIAAKLEERDTRHTRNGSSRYQVEPNIKDGKGGLRDLHTLFWIGKYFYNVGKSSQLVQAGLFTRSEYRRFRMAERFLWTVRCHMHFLTGKAEERLSFDIQREIANRLKYLSHGGLLDVERFMKHYFLVAKEVGDLTLITCAELEERQAKEVTGIHGLIRSFTRRTKKIRGSKDFLNDNGRINIADSEVFERDPVNMLRLFQLADKHNLDFHPDAVQLVSKSLKLVDKKTRLDPVANRLFLDILTTKNGPETLLRRMNESGLLGRFIPAFGKVVAMMQYNMYHHYTVDEHLIQSVGALWGIVSGKLAAEHPLSAELLPQIKDLEVLYVALLIHDIAKGRKEDHSIAGAKIAKQICPRLGMTQEQTDLISWLVLEHLTMSMVAQSRDLSDRKTIQDFANKMQTVERMRYLVVLTVCDIRAVGPGVWNGWKGQLIRTLYYETEPLLTGGFSRIPRHTQAAHARDLLRDELSDWSEAEKDTVLSLPYTAYFLSTDMDAQARNMKLLKRATEENLSFATDVYTNKFEAMTEITVVTHDHPRLLSIITGACSAAGANIVDAKIHTTSNGMALDSIIISRTYDEDEDELRRAERILATIEDTLEGKVKLPEFLASKTKNRRKHKHFQVKTIVGLDNDLSETFTVIEVECLDRAGLLSDITRVLADLNLDIGSAQISTFGEKVQDSFYVRDLVGHKITEEKRQLTINRAILKVIEIQPKTEPKKQEVA